LWGKRHRVGVLLNVDDKDVWFNDYGTEEGLTKKYDAIGVDERVNVEYIERPYTDRQGNQRVARDIKSFVREQKTLSAKDAKAFMNETEINIEKLLKDLDRISSIASFWRCVLVGEKTG